MKYFRVPKIRRYNLKAKVQTDHTKKASGGTIIYFKHTLPVMTEDIDIEMLYLEHTSITLNREVRIVDV